MTGMTGIDEERAPRIRHVAGMFETAEGIIAAGNDDRRAGERRAATVDTLDFARAAPTADLVCLHDACDPKTKPIMGCRADKNQTFEDSIKCCDFRLITVNV